jgi:uncharacterized protein
MAVSCPQCGRQYDVTLFQFGRTINCACGRRVGFEHKINLSRDEAIKFFADVNVARVARWLRAIGIDTAWEDAIADGELVKRAIEEKRFVLTLDKRLIGEWRADNVLLLRSENPFAQFCEIIAHFGLEKPEELFTRCLVCNTLLRRAEAAEISENAPPGVQENHEKFHYCPDCNKVYWEGSHARRMKRAIEEAFAAQNSKGKAQN